MAEPGAEPREYDVVVIGAGPVGENAADRAARTGLSVVVAEHELVGGECSYWACMPSKALLRPGAALAAARAVPGAARAVNGTVDVAGTLEQRDEFSAHWQDSAQVQWLADAGLDLIRGHARLTGPRLVEVIGDEGTTTLRARAAVVVATGSAALVPDVPGLDQVQPWTSREATAVREVPESLAVIGGGVVGTEMATALSDLGCRVTMLVRGDRLLSGIEPFAGEAVADGLRQMGVDVRFNTAVTEVSKTDDGVAVQTSDGTQVRAAQVLVATGRRPRTQALGLESVGLPAGEPLGIDDSGQVRDVAGGWLFAAGDVTGRTHTTHQGKYTARVAGDVIAGRFGQNASSKNHNGMVAPSNARSHGHLVPDVGGSGDVVPGTDEESWSPLRARADHTAAPQVVFTRPEVAAVGMTYQQAIDAGYRARAVNVSFDDVAGAALAGDDHGGGAMVVVDTERQVLLGATFVGPAVAELLHAATIAVAAEVPLARLWHAVPAFPTISEIWLRLLEDYGL